jgi:hypothetical protein
MDPRKTTIVHVDLQFTKALLKISLTQKIYNVHVQARLELALLGPQIYMYMFKPG